MTPGFRMGLAVFQVVVGAACFVVGLRGPLVTRSQAPLGVICMLTGSLQLLDRSFPDNTVLIALYVLGFVASSVWFVRVIRASQAQQRELLRQRHADELTRLPQTRP